MNPWTMKWNIKRGHVKEIDVMEGRKFCIFGLSETKWVGKGQKGLQEDCEL